MTSLIKGDYIVDSSINSEDDLNKLLEEVKSIDNAPKPIKELFLLDEENKKQKVQMLNE